MFAKLVRLHSPDLDDLESFHPERPDAFGFLLQFMVAPQGEEDAEESFDVLVCTPKWLMENHKEHEIVVGRHHLIVFKYDFLTLKKFITEVVKNCSGSTWEDIANCLSQIGKWEFEGYVD